jgi:OOP family OmpA-OmpF porin
MTNPISLPLASTVLLMLAAAPAMAADPVLEPVRVRALAHFDFDAAALRPADRAALLAGVLPLKDVSWQLVTAVGHTDSLGDPAYNHALAQRRAEAVRDHLVAQGLDPAMIRVVAQGEAAPEADNSGPAGRARNRRTEVQFSGVRPLATR